MIGKRIGPRVARLARALMVCACAVGAAAEAGGGDWPQWRGPERNGIASGGELPRELPDRLELRWRVEVGEGHSSPVVLGERVFILVRQGANEVCMALDAGGGEELWRHEYPAQYRPDSSARAHGLGPKATVTAQGGRVYSFGIAQRLTCLETETGKVIWEKRFEDEYKPAWPQFGTASSVLIEGDLAIVEIGNQKRGALAAFDKATGEEVWREKTLGPAYDSPIAVTLGGVRVIVSFTRMSVMGVAADDGRQLWSRDFTTPYEQNIVTALADGEGIVISGTDRGVTALRFSPDASALPWKVASRWRQSRHGMYMSSPVIHDGALYFFSEKKKGMLVCLDARSGEVLWESSGRSGENASVIVTGDRLLVLNNEGELKVIAADRGEYRELGGWRVADSPTWAHPALAGGRVYVKDQKHLACFKF